MCTLIAVHRCIPGRWLAVGANRDEFFDRPSEPPRIRLAGETRVVAPLDRRAGGTWLGVGAHGVFAALTNLASGSPDPTMKSRGSIVWNALSCESARDAATVMEALPVRSFNPFNCFVADEQEAFLISYRDRPEAMPLEPGVYVIGNADALASRQGCRGDATGRDPKQVRVERVEAQVEAALSLSGEDRLAALQTICRLHGTPEDEQAVTCLHGSDTYGTRSSILLEMSDADRESRLLYADGAPCTSEYSDFSSLLDELRCAPSYGSTESPMRISS
ncbi:NRDE family protein [Myxococcota bacterium]|nr:NRDE family protein [Myxococcota bacterium]